jgi:hypothetical protein
MGSCIALNWLKTGKGGHFFECGNETKYMGIF